MRAATVAVLLTLATAAPAHAAGYFERTWGKDVIGLNAETGPEVCTVSDQCKGGAAAGVGGALYAPSGAATDAAGNVYVVEQAANRVQVYTGDGAFLRMWGKDVVQGGTTGFEVCTDAPLCQLGTQGSLGGELSHPKGVAVDAAGNVFVADTDNHRVQQYTSAGGFTRAFGKNVDAIKNDIFEICTLAMDCKAGDATPPPNPGGDLYAPQGLAVDATGLYVASGLRRVEKLTITADDVVFDRAWGRDVIQGGFAGFEVCTDAAQCKLAELGSGLGGEMALIVGVAVDGAGSVYTMSANRFRVDKFTAAGAWVRTWGKDVVQGGGEAFEICDVAANCKPGVTGSKGGEFRSPNDIVAPTSAAIAAGPSGTVYVADRENHRLQLFSPDGDFLAVWGLNVDTTAAEVGIQVCTVAADCTGGSQESPLPGGGMSSPTGVAVAASGDVFEVDQTASRIQRFGCSAAAEPTCDAPAAPGAPTLTGTDPSEQPSGNDAPNVLGTADAGSTVDLYDNPDCTGTPIGTGTAAQFASPGIPVTVPPDQITQIYAKASNAGGSSACSSAPLTYEQIATQRWEVTVGAAAASVDESAGPVTVTVSRDGDTTGTAIVEYATADGTATTSDYTPAAGTLRFDPGQAAKTVPVAITGDQRHEADETLTFALSDPGLGTQLGTPSTETITIVDDDPIDTAITAGPDGPINTATATFSFLAEPPEGATFACSIDGAAAVACTSPHTTAALADGPHTFSVTASTPGGTADPSPATRGFFVDTVAPQSGLDVRATPGAGAQTGPGVFTGSVTVSAIGADPDPGSGIGQVGCSLDPLAVPTTADEVRAGTCPVVTAPGDHVAYAVATDKAGNTGPIVTSTFRIIAAPDTFITSGPTSVSWTTTPTFTFTSTDPAATFRCKVDAYDAVDCKSPFRILPGVSGSGAHSIAVTAVSPAGVADPSPARRDFKVGETETHDFGCGLNGFAVDPASNDGYAGCTIEPAGQPCSGLYPACQSAVPACPVGAFCRYDVKVNGADKDLHVNLLTNAVVVERVTPEVREKHGFAYLLPGYLTSAGCFHNDPTQDGGGSCPASAFNQIIGDGSAPSFLCPTNSSRNTSGGILPKLGPDADRFSRCDFKMTIEAAPTLVVLPADDGITTYAPGAGRLSAAPAGAGGRTAAIARAEEEEEGEAAVPQDDQAREPRWARAPQARAQPGGQEDAQEEEAPRPARQADLQAQAGQDGQPDRQGHAAQAGQAEGDPAVALGGGGTELRLASGRGPFGRGSRSGFRRRVGRLLRPRGLTKVGDEVVANPFEIFQGEEPRLGSAPRRDLS